MTGTAPPGLPNTTGDIILKIRRITKMPNSNQITDAQVYQYINTYYLYDFPQELRLKNCLSNYEFVTIPYQESYPLPTDTIITVEPPVYINGYQSFFTQSQDNFYMLYPPLALEYNGPSGNGTIGPYPFQITSPAGVPQQAIMQNRVVVSVIDQASQTASAIATDLPTNTTTGTFTGQGLGSTVTMPTISSSINYVTGQITMVFGNSIPSTSQIIVQYVPYVPSRSVAMLLYNDMIYLRPIPDKAYPVRLQAFINPYTAMLGAEFNPPGGWTYSPASGAGSGYNDPQYPQPPAIPQPAQSPPVAGFNNIMRGFVGDTDTAQVKQWWQLIALGASLLIFEDRGDFEQLAVYQQRYDRQLKLALRRTLVEMSNERTATIYTEQSETWRGNFMSQF